MTCATTVHLSAEDHAAFERDGFLIIRQALAPAYLEQCQAVTQTWIEQTIRQWQDAGLIESDFAELGFRERFLAAWRAADEPRYARSPRRETVQLEPEKMFSILHSPALLDIAEQILGTHNIASHGIFNLRPKAPSQRYTDTPWHQDAQYFPDYADVNMVNMWFPMHDVDVAGSCLAFAAGKHRDGLFENDESERNNGFIGLTESQAASMQASPAELAAGDLVIFTNTTPHVAMPNTSGVMRWSWDLRFIDCADCDDEVMQLASIARHTDERQLTDFETFKNKWHKAEW